MNKVLPVIRILENVRHNRFCSVFKICGFSMRKAIGEENKTFYFENVKRDNATFARAKGGAKGSEEPIPV